MSISLPSHSTPRIAWVIDDPLMTKDPDVMVLHMRRNDVVISYSSTNSLNLFLKTRSMLLSSEFESSLSVRDSSRPSLLKNVTESNTLSDLQRLNVDAGVQ